ncbi:MAG: type II toxin-antitoxin system VapC family toxin [Gracilimonas sp.]|nr:type II toxin-antitoxin system VapC family toxin [Gracilimonas sp.]
MAAIDTNILIRFLVRDDEGQFQQVLALFEEYRERSLTINVHVIVEAAWVLSGLYNYSKDELIQTFRHLINTEALDVQDDKIIEKALDMYELSNADFEDCLITAQNEFTNHSPTFTFDKKASKLKGMKLLR